MSDLRCPHVGCNGTITQATFGYERDTFECSNGHDFDIDVREPEA